ncbi:MAG: DUF4339 domain-containing protein [Proteobacteria bacterium]|nr:DUF4339 domain-containing protein [Pseudomonadota bacterium]
MMTTGQASDIQWYIARDGKQHGPLTDVEMRTFVAHNYLRLSDLIWRPGMPEWQSAPNVFPTAFEALGQDASPTANGAEAGGAQHQRAAYSQGSIQHDPRDPDFNSEVSPRPERNIVKRLALASVAITLIGGGAFAVTSYRDVIMGMVSGTSGGTSAEDAPVVAAPADPSSSAETASTAQAASTTQTTGAEPAADPPSQTVASSDSGGPSVAPTVASENGVVSSLPPPSPPPADTTTSSVSAPTPDAPQAPSTQNAQTQVAAIDPQSPAPPSPPSIDGSPLDHRLQTIPVWALIKREYPDWYSNEITSADKLIADKKSDSDVATLLAEGLVTLRRQNADKALAASSEKLQAIAEAFLNHLKALRAQSVSACFGFISKGETSPAVIQMMEHPETATALNAQADAIFEAISEGSKNPVKHDSAVKSDYDILIKELGKLGWKEEDLQVFSNPKLLAKREPEQVCKMVQEWFIAHLAVQDKAVRDRLLYETLKPVVSG